MANKPMIGEYLAESLSNVPAAVAENEHFVDVNKMADEDITSRVLQLKVDAGNAILEIGRWLTVMKERKAHGEWLSWLESVDIREHAAQRFMRLHREYSANPTLVSDLGQTKALMLLAIPSEEREIFATEIDAASMTKDELQKAIRERDEARAALDTALADVKKAEEYAAGLQADMSTMEVERDAAKARVKELEDLPKDVYQDEAAIKKAAAEARAAAEAEMQKKIDALKSKLKKAEEKAELAGVESNAEATKAKAEADRLRAELDAAKREQAKASISGDADLAAFQLLFEQVQADVNKMRGLLLKVRGREDSDLGEKLAKALLALADAVKECAA